MAKYMETPEVSWVQSIHITNAIHIKLADIPRDEQNFGTSCTRCMFRNDNAESLLATHPHLFVESSPCSTHGCHGGVWVDKVQAAAWRLEK